MPERKKFFLISSLVILFLIFIGIFLMYSFFLPKPIHEVVIYTSVDQVYSEPVLKEFETRTGIRVLAVYDVEAAKTTGLVNRLLAEKNNPRADVFWNGEIAQTLLLKENGVLDPYQSPVAVTIPDQYHDNGYYWTGFGGRARVILVNTDLLHPDDYPRSLSDLATTSIPARNIGMAYPIFGTTATQVSAIYALWGEEEARQFYQTLRDRNIRILDGNAAVRDFVASGDLAAGLTDSDDACGAIARGYPVKIIFPDQEASEMGTLIIPNTVALIRGAPHPDEGRKLIDYLLSPEVESRLLESGWIQVTVRQVEGTSPCGDVRGVKGMNVTFAEIAAHQEAAKRDMTEIFVRV
jgi:iron(III) transport system substrate-binding protein